MLPMNAMMATASSGTSDDQTTTDAARVYKSNNSILWQLFYIYCSSFQNTPGRGNALRGIMILRFVGRQCTDC